LGKKVEEFCEKLADNLETDEVKLENVLKDFEECDSLSALSIIAMVDSDFGVTIFAKDIMKIKTVKDLLSLIQKKSSLFSHIKHQTPVW
jgi:acyl carrier protein